MASKEIPHIGKHANLAQERYSDKFGEDTAWNRTKSALTPSEIMRQAIQRQRIQSEDHLLALDEEIDVAWEGASKGTGAQKTACLRQLEDAHDKRDEIKSTLHPTAGMSPDSAPKAWKSVLSFLGEFQPGDTVSQVKRSGSSSTAITDHLTPSSDKSRNCNHPGLPLARLASNADVQSSSISKASHKFAPWPPRSRGSYSETSLPSKRTGEAGSFKNKRSTSEQISRKINHGRYGTVGRGPKSLAEIPRRKFTLEAFWKASTSMNGRAETQSVHPLSRKPSTAQERKVITKTRVVRSVSQNPGFRFSQRLARKQNRTTNPLKADEPLKNHTSKKRKRSSEPDLSGRLRPRLRDKTGIDKQGLSGDGKTASLSRARRTADERTDVAKLTVQIPADTDMATEHRGYSQWPGTCVYSRCMSIGLITPSR
jgi:hypothetical protein